MFGRFAKQDSRFAATEWSPGYFVNTTSKQKGLPPAREGRQQTKHEYDIIRYGEMLTTSRSMGPSLQQSLKQSQRAIPKPPRQACRPEGTSLGGLGGMHGLCSPLQARTRQRHKIDTQQDNSKKNTNHQHLNYHVPVNKTTRPKAHDNSQNAYIASQQISREEPTRSVQEDSLRLISIRGDNPFVKQLQDIIDVRTGIERSRRRSTEPLSKQQQNQIRETPPRTPDANSIYNENENDPVYDGTLARDPSAEFTLDIDGDGDVDPDEQAHASKVGKFQWCTDLKKRAALRIFEGKLVLAGVFINQYRHDMEVLEPTFARLSSREMTNMLAESDNFSEWLDELKEKAANLPLSVFDTDDALNNYLDIDGDGAIDADELLMQHRIGKFAFIEDPVKRTEARLKEGQYIYALDFLWNNRDIMWIIDRRYQTMNQKEILDVMLSHPDYHMMLQTLRAKAQALRLGGSKQLRECLGGSKNYIPSKEQMIQRRMLELNHAARKNARDYICEKVDLESTFRKKNLGYSSPSGWGTIYMENLSMLRGGSKIPGASISLLKQAKLAKNDGSGDSEWVAFNN